MISSENKNEIFSERLITSVLWNIALQISVAVVLVLIIQIDLLHPISWITSTITDIFGWKMGLNIVLLCLVSCFQAYLYGTYYIVPLPKQFTRFSMFLNMFTLQNITLSTLYALSGYFTLGLYSSLAKSTYNVLTKKCEHYEGQCLEEQSLFLQFGGMWVGLYYFFNIHIFRTATLVFPPIYQNKFQQIKLVISDLISSGFQNSIPPVIYYCLFYYLWGSKPRSVISDVYDAYLEDPPLDNLLNLILSGIWIGLWFYTSLFFISVYIMKTIFNIVLTEPMKFPIESDTQLTLAEALALTSKFNGYLGAHDFRNLAIADPMRRTEIFKLSLPGGHPRNWNNILEKCLAIINEFNNELDNINNNMKPVEITKSSHSSSQIFSPTNIRNMANSPKLYIDLKDYCKNKPENALITTLKNEFNVFKNKLIQKPGINYIFGELTDTKLKFLLMQAQPVMWTCEGLAFIAAASLNEDNFGVVQNDLPVIITALVKLKQQLEKLSRPGLVPKKHILNDLLAVRMKSALISSVKRSIYKIVLTFSKYMSEIPLSPDIEHSVQPFLLCKEP